MFRCISGYFQTAFLCLLLLTEAGSARLAGLRLTSFVQPFGQFAVFAEFGQCAAYIEPNPLVWFFAVVVEMPCRPSVDAVQFVDLAAPRYMEAKFKGLY